MVSIFLSRIFRVQEKGIRGMRERRERKERKWMKRGGNDAPEMS